MAMRPSMAPLHGLVFYELDSSLDGYPPTGSIWVVAVV
jgi:hypothetical protein